MISNLDNQGGLEPDELVPGMLQRLYNHLLECPMPLGAGVITSFRGRVVHLSEIFPEGVEVYEPCGMVSMCPGQFFGGIGKDFAL